MNSSLDTDAAVLAHFRALHTRRQQQIQARLSNGPGLVTISTDGQPLTRKLSVQDIQDLREGKLMIDDLFAGLMGEVAEKT